MILCFYCNDAHVVAFTAGTMASYIFCCKDCYKKSLKKQGHKVPTI